MRAQRRLDERFGHASFLNRRMASSGRSVAPVIFLTTSSSSGPHASSSAARYRDLGNERVRHLASLDASVGTTARCGLVQTMFRDTGTTATRAGLLFPFRCQSLMTENNGTENPRVGGSTPSGGTLEAVELADSPTEFVRNAVSQTGFGSMRWATKPACEASEMRRDNDRAPRDLGELGPVSQSQYPCKFQCF